jgi:prepilin-type N-terminal cleavage/methylation domain-containing protein
MKVLTCLGATCLPPRFERGSALGFTLVEKIAVMAIVGTLMAIAAPGWITFFNARSLNAAQDTVFQTIRLAQIRAEQTRSHWQASFRTDSYGFAQVAAHSITTPPDQILWQDLDAGIEFYADEMTFPQTNGVYRVRFNHLGQVHGLMLGRVTLIRRNNFQAKRCVTVSTLLGAVRKDCPQL